MKPGARVSPGSATASTGSGTLRRAVPRAARRAARHTPRQTFAAWQTSCVVLNEHVCRSREYHYFTAVYRFVSNDAHGKRSDRVKSSGLSLPCRCSRLKSSFSFTCSDARLLSSLMDCRRSDLGTLQIYCNMESLL